MQRVRHEYDKWYKRACYQNLRKLTLARDPICMVCHRSPSTICDHVRPHRGDWALFLDLKNTQGLCKQCHDVKTATEDGGFSNPSRVNAGPVLAPTGSKHGQEFQSSSIPAKKLDTALDFDVKSLLDGIPE